MVWDDEMQMYKITPQGKVISVLGGFVIGGVIAIIGIVIILFILFMIKK